MRQKDKIELIITVLLVIILIVFTARALGKKAKSPSETSSSMVMPTNSVIPDTEPLYVRLEEQAQQMQLKRDPFNKVSETQESKTPSLHLK